MYDALSEAAVMTNHLSPKSLEAITPPVVSGSVTIPDKKYRVWWIPQLGMKKTFYVPVNKLETAAILLEVLAKYDIFQYENKVKGDYANAGGVSVWSAEQYGADCLDKEVKEEDRGWCDWYDDETGDDLDVLLRDNNGVLPERLRGL